MKESKPRMPAGEPGHITDPGLEGRPPSSDFNLKGAFRALLDWNLQVSLRPSPGGKLYTVYTVADAEVDERAALLVDTPAAELVAWVASRQTQELFPQLPEMGVVLLIGAPMAGKTFAALQLARAAINTGPVIYAALEDREAVLRARIFDEMSAEDADELRDLTIIPELPRIGAEPGALDVLEHHLAEMRPALVVVDCLAFIRPEPEAHEADRAEANQAAVDQLQALAVKHASRFVVVHHIKPEDQVASLSAAASATLQLRPGQPVNFFESEESKVDASVDLRIEAAMTLVAGLYLDLATLHGEVVALAKIAKQRKS